jgi:hypothetical protein
MMNMQTQLMEKLGDALAKFLDNALAGISSPFMKFLVVLVVALIVIFGIAQDCAAGPELAIECIVVLIVFSLLAGALHYLELKLDYGKKTEECLKKTIREVVQEREYGRLIEEHLKGVIRDIVNERPLPPLSG